MPIILRNLYTDDVGDIHTRFHAFSIRERLAEDGDDDPNLLLWTAPTGDLVATAARQRRRARTSRSCCSTSGSRPGQAGGRDQPCLLADGTVLTGGWELYDEPGPCADAYPVHGDPRTRRGQARRGDVIKCALTDSTRDVRRRVHTRAAERPATIFPDGVCDWTQPASASRHRRHVARLRPEREAGV